MLLLPGCDLSQDELATLDNANKKIDLGADPLSEILAEKNDQNVDRFITLAASDGDRVLEFSDIYRHREDDWVKQIIGKGGGKVEDNAAAALARMKTALAAALIARDFPKLAPVAMDAVKSLLSVPEYGLDCLDKRFLEAAAATLRLMKFRDDCKREKSRHEVLGFVESAVDATLSDLLAGHILFTVKDQLAATDECPDGNKANYIPGEAGARDQIEIRRDIFASDEGAVTLVHEAIHASYDHEGDNGRKNTLDLALALTPTVEQAYASAAAMAAQTLLYGNEILNARRVARDQACTSWEAEKKQLEDDVKAHRTTSRKKPLDYIHRYVGQKTVAALEVMAKLDAEVYGAELILSRGKFWDEAVMVELMSNAATHEAVKRTQALYFQVMELEGKIIEDAKSVCQCGLDPTDDPLLLGVFPANSVAGTDPATGEPVTYVNHTAFFQLARKRAKGQENHQAITWWLDRQVAAVAKLKQGDVAGANALLDQALATMIDTEAQRQMGLKD